MGTPRVVIVGGGFAGLSAARGLASAPVEVLLIDRHNYHLFQPLLYQVATAGLSPGEIAWPIRSLLRRQRNARVVLGEIVGVDTDARTVRVGESDVSYDYLVLATGARHGYFGHSHWEPHAPGLKTVDDATEIRRRILVAFERAEIEPDPETRRALLTFVIVGGGPTGVELAGALVELAKKALARDFRRIDPSTARVILVEAGGRVLPTFPETLSSNAATSLERLGVEVRSGAAVTDCDTDGVVIGTERIDARTVLWAAGSGSICPGMPRAASPSRAISVCPATRMSTSSATRHESPGVSSSYRASRRPRSRWAAMSRGPSGRRSTASTRSPSGTGTTATWPRSAAAGP
jgi:NADH dehydrogenase